MTLTDIAKQVEKYTVDNSPSIMTGIGVVGTIATAYLTAKSTYRAVGILDAEEHRLVLDQSDKVITNTDIVKLVWMEFIPPVATGVITVFAIIGANRIGSRRAAAVAAAYSLSEKAYSEYREKIIQKLGDKKEQKARDEIAQERVDRTPVAGSAIIGSGTVLCCDSTSMRYFMSDMESIRKAQNDLNDTILRYNYASLSDFYDNLGLPKTALSDEVGWNSDKLLTLQFTTAMSDDNRPCIYIEYQAAPIRHYAARR